MRKYRIILVMATLALAIGTSVIMANKATEGEGICITIAPSTLILSKDTACVTIHSNLPIGLVDCDSLTLEGIEPVLVKADSLGHLVAKFDEEAIKAIVLPGQATLTLTGDLADGSDFAASDTITVRE
jgi:hypothetical protein